MSFWTEIRPPRPTEQAPSDNTSRFASISRSLPDWLPAIVAIALLLAALGVLADQQSTSHTEPEIRLAALPTESRLALIDLNTATIAELSILPGIGETRAQAIVLLRAQQPFRSLADLADRGVLRPTEILALADVATVYVATH